MESAIAQPAALRLRHPWAATIDGAIGIVVEPLAALLIVAEVVILAAGVVFRYGLHNALNWSDEISGILLLWLAMLGSVVAYRRREHIRITALERVASPRLRSMLDAISSVVVALFCVEMLPASYRLMAQEAAQTTPALGIPHSWILDGIVVPIALILAHLPPQKASEIMVGLPSAKQI